MTLSRKILIVSFIVSILGFILAVISDDDALGKTLFFLGFFMACGAAVYTVLVSNSYTFGGDMGIGVKIMVGGFGIIALGQLLKITLNLNDFGDKSFSVGMVVMLLGIVVAAVKKVR